MSAYNATFELYQKYAPRWFKVIRWREWGNRIVDHQKKAAMYFYLPIYICWITHPDIFAYKMYFFRPKTPQEIRQLKQNNWKQDVYQRDWEYGEYDKDVAPVYDLSRRRLKYPEYYEGRYKIVDKTVWGEVLGERPKKLKE